MTERKKQLFQNTTRLLIGLAVAVTVCCFLGGSFLSLVHNKLEFKRLTKISAQLDKDYQQLQEKLELLEKQDPAYVERVARVQYHMSRKGETEFRFKPK